jgi:hypothetical protein
MRVDFESILAPGIQAKLDDARSANLLPTFTPVAQTRGAGSADLRALF